MNETKDNIQVSWQVNRLTDLSCIVEFIAISKVLYLYGADTDLWCFNQIKTKVLINYLSVDYR